jgi:hypothetical protein
MVEVMYKPSCKLVAPTRKHLHPYPGEAQGSDQTKLDMLAEKGLPLGFVELPFGMKVRVGEATPLGSW